MREILFRAWSNKNKEMFYPSSNAQLFNLTPFCDFEVMQYTGLKDRNGAKIFEGDLINVFFTSSNGEHIHDCVYSVRLSALGGIELNFHNLVWELHGYNQYTLVTTLKSSYSNLKIDPKNTDYDRLAVSETYGENRLLGHRWKELDESNYFEIIGNIHDKGNDGQGEGMAQETPREDQRV